MGDGRVTARLTLREVEAAVRLGRGLPLDEIAAKMGCARHTVIAHLKNARQKTGALTSAQLAVMVAVQRDRERRAADPQEGRPAGEKIPAQGFVN